MLNEKMKIQLEEKERTVSNLQRGSRQLELRLGERENQELAETDTAKKIREDTDGLHQALRNIAEAVIGDAGEDLAERDDVDACLVRAPSPTRARSSSPAIRSKSPTFRMHSPKRAPSPAFADATFSAVQAALNKRQLQVSDLRTKLVATRDHSSVLKKQLDDAENEKRRLEIQIINLREDLDIV